MTPVCLLEPTYEAFVACVKCHSKYVSSSLEMVGGGSGERLLFVIVANKGERRKLCALIQFTGW